jgi:hypothetical protein
VPDLGRTDRAENPTPAPNGRPGPGPVFVGDLLERSGRPLQKRHSRLPIALAAITAAVIVGAALLLTTTHALRPLYGSGEPAPNGQHITGAKVFRPDLIGASAGESTNPGSARPAPRSGDQPSPDPAGDGQPVDGSGDVQPAPADAQSPAQQAPATSGASATPATPAQPAPATTSGSPVAATPSGTLCETLRVSDPVLCHLLGPVQAFYTSAPIDPAAAFAMLDDGLRAGTDLQAFTQSWSEIERATVNSASLVDRQSVQVRVTYLREDGSRLITEQRLKVRGGAKPRILDAQLLSAVIA